MVITPSDARMLCMAIDIDRVRVKFRVGDTNAYQLLAEITACAKHNADTGNVRSPQTVFDKTKDSEPWTVKRLAAATRLAPRTIVSHINNGLLHARKVGNAHIIAETDAQTFINSRKAN